ncbi:DNA uptake protein ComE-like DNA-binding protein [Herbaspirillum sp. 1173]|uniref:ComEA family DNA-binding protein n=1 Tax=Herbaspirillum sp. 1173 TaxID=2817734 RepID=UPI002855A0DC|nr:helix-hairpin-helix domain-containing protein [Herbaspirillum sp. 1173]MDR6739123.1 DNA uptake protein ComE-like DNA-binding protein [Herbaspirillum sp. 1173]
MTQKNEALRLLDESLKEIESSRGSVLSAVQKLLRASALVNNHEVQYWCEIQLGNSRFVGPLKKLYDLIRAPDDGDKEKKQKAIYAARETLDEMGLKSGTHYSSEEFQLKIDVGSGGYEGIAFIEERYADLVRTKKGNDGTYYKNNLLSHLNYVKQKTHSHASELFNRLKFSGTVTSCFDVLKSAVDDKLLDINPMLAEQLMLSFKGVSSAKDEEWSQALTSSRRFLEGLADQLYPASTEPTKGRPLNQAQYVNRLWAFMDKAIESDSNKELAKAHVDFLGAWLEKTNKIANKGVHAEVTQLEAVKAIFHLYLVVADLLGYIDAAKEPKAQLDINSASLDELETLLNVTRATAKEIFKARLEHGRLDKSLLEKVPGVGAKTLAKAVTVFSL